MHSSPTCVGLHITQQGAAHSRHRYNPVANRMQGRIPNQEKIVKNMKKQLFFTILFDCLTANQSEIIACVLVLF